MLQSPESVLMETLNFYLTTEFADICSQPLTICRLSYAANQINIPNWHKSNYFLSQRFTLFNIPVLKLAIVMQNQQTPNANN